ncbi:MAG: F0F1 ATP synthase subunit delta [Arcobacteraceae bacterium]|jgi:F-type H+-transporting ATPase subunit delta|nr:F0F1 ATP synthase subunit delta [Arcobacteraceae bacterium]
MSNLVAKRYVKALLKGRDSDHIDIINNQLKLIASAYKDEKFINIIGSVDVTTYQKVDLLLSFIGNNDYIVNNLLILLGKNRRLTLIPAISEELEKEFSILMNNYGGIVYSSTELTSDYMLEIQNKFSNKFGINLTLTNQVCDYDGIKVEIDGLGVEIGFEKNKFKSQMIEHILKAV